MLWWHIWACTQLSITLILKQANTHSKGCRRLTKRHTTQTVARDFLTLLWQLANIRGDSHVQHVIDSRVNIVSSLHIVFAVGLITLLMATILQTVPLQVLECWCATWRPVGRRGKCWLTVTSWLTWCPFVLSVMVCEELSIVLALSLFYGLSMNFCPLCGRVPHI